LGVTVALFSQKKKNAWDPRSLRGAAAKVKKRNESSSLKRGVKKRRGRKVGGEKKKNSREVGPASPQCNAQESTE